MTLHRAIDKFFKQLFCDHSWESVDDLSSGYRTYQKIKTCNKCNKIEKYVDVPWDEIG